MDEAAEAVADDKTLKADRYGDGASLGDRRRRLLVELYLQLGQSSEAGLGVERVDLLGFAGVSEPRRSRLWRPSRRQGL
ncbi:hypothetical protein [Methylocystis parvus]|uniref:hypothetical protein n=1 Tax=Methylocystis parvus TaxID=134 RepID=UPI003C71F24F